MKTNIWPTFDTADLMHQITRIIFDRYFCIKTFYNAEYLGSFEENMQENAAFL